MAFAGGPSPYGMGTVPLNPTMPMGVGAPGIAANPALGAIHPQTMGGGYPMVAPGMATVPGQANVGFGPTAGAASVGMRPIRGGAGTSYYFLAIFLPPLAVLTATGSLTLFFINLLLTILGWLPGVFHAWYIVSRSPVAYL